MDVVFHVRPNEGEIEDTEDPTHPVLPKNSAHNASSWEMDIGVASLEEYVDDRFSYTSE